MLKGLIFDLDGVLTDTAKFHLQAWNEVAKQLGIALSPEALEQLRGRSRRDSLDLILSYGATGQMSEAEKEQLAAEKNTLFLQLIAQLTPQDVLPGIQTLLVQAQGEGLKMAIASASRNAPTVLARLELAPFFAAIVDPAQLHHGKPDPEIFQLAQQSLGLANDEVISFEDASVGVAAIKAAGQFAVGIGEATILKAADLIVPTTAQLNLQTIEQAFTSAQR